MLKRGIVDYDINSMKLTKGNYSVNENGEVCTEQILEVKLVAPIGVNMLEINLFKKEILK
jgi:hypothetical protein